MRAWAADDRDRVRGDREPIDGVVLLVGPRLRTRDVARSRRDALSERVLAVINEADAPIVTARDGSTALPEGAAKKLIQLREQGRVERQKVGGRAVVWWLPDSEKTLNSTGEHDPESPFFAGEPLGDEAGDPIDVADTNDLLGDAIASDTE